MLNKIRTYRQRALFRKISALTDQPENPMARARLDKILKDPAAKKVHDDIMRVKRLLQERIPLSPTIGFTARFQTALEERGRGRAHQLYSRYWLSPAMATITISAAVVIFALVIVQPDALTRLFREKSQMAVEDYYRKPLEGTLLPLLAGLTPDDVLRFAMDGALPVDAKEETELRISESEGSDVTLRLEKQTKPRTPRTNRDQFYEKVRANPEQRETINALLTMAQEKMRRSILISEQKQIAVQSDLGALNKYLIAGIHSTLNARQRVLFARILEDRGSPYSVAIHMGTHQTVPTTESMRQMIVSQSDDEFVIISPETLVVHRLDIEMNIFDVQEQSIKDFAKHRDSILALALDRFQSVREPAIQQIKVIPEDEGFSIQISAPTNPPIDLRQVVFPRAMPAARRSGVELRSNMIRVDSVAGVARLYLEDKDGGAQQFMPETRAEDRVRERLRELKDLEQRVDSLFRQLDNPESLNELMKFRKRKVEDPRDI